MVLWDVYYATGFDINILTFILKYTEILILILLFCLFIFLNK